MNPAIKAVMYEYIKYNVDYDSSDEKYKQRIIKVLHDELEMNWNQAEQIAQLYIDEMNKAKRDKVSDKW